MLSNKALHYILDGDTPVPADLMTWARWYEDATYQRITARTYLSRTGDDLPPDGDVLLAPDDAYAMVSTVFLGSDQGYAWQLDDAPPILFETMIRLYDGEAGDDGAGFLAPQWRYATAAQARAMHARIVAQAQGWLREGRPLADIGDEEWVNEDGEETTQP